MQAFVTIPLNKDNQTDKMRSCNPLDAPPKKNKLLESYLSFPPLGSPTSCKWFHQAACSRSVPFKATPRVGVGRSHPWANESELKIWSKSGPASWQTTATSNLPRPASKIEQASLAMLVQYEPILTHGLGTGLGNVSASLVSFAASLRFDKTPCRSWKSSARYPPWQHEWLRTRKIQLILTDCVTTVIHSQEAIHRIPEESWILKALCEKMSTYWHGCDWDS